MTKAQFLFAAFAGLPGFVFAQGIKKDTTTLHEVVIVENRMQTPFSKLARNIQLIIKEDIAKMPVKSLNEVLGLITGVDLRQRGPFGTQADVSIDGGSFEQTLILLNGVKISDAQTAHHSLNIPVPLAAVERIEVLKGPAARIYGINALTGAINIVTKTSDKSTFTVNTQMGSNFKDKAPGDGSGTYGGGSIQTVINLAGKEHQHLLAFARDDYNGQRYNSATKDDRFFYQGKLAFNEKNTASIMGGYIHNAFGASGYYASPIDKEAEEIVNTALLALSTSHQVTKNFTIRPQFSSRYNWDDYRFYRNKLSVARSQHRTDAWSGELNSVLHTRSGDFGFGIEARSENIHSTNIGHKERENYGAYAEYKTEAIRNMLVNVGTYLNYNTQYGWQLFPGLDAAYLINSKWRASFNLGTSQRIPSFTDLYLRQAPANIGNANLKSENAWQYELAIQYRSDKFNWRTGYFHRQIEGYIDWIRSANNVPYQPQNFGLNKMNGVSTSLNHTLKFDNSHSFDYELAYQYLSAPKASYPQGVNSKYTVEHLEHQLIARLNYRYQGFSIGLNNRWIERKLKNPYFITDARLQYSKNSWSIFSDISNIFDEKYIEVAAVPLPSRWFSLGINLHLDLKNQ
jgi:iron complex outermembrane receptor protein